MIAMTCAIPLLRRMMMMPCRLADAEQKHVRRINGDFWAAKGGLGLKSIHGKDAVG